MNILLVDDERLARSVSMKYLKRINAKISIYEAANADEAKLILASETIDLIILDIEMPGQNGIEFALETKPNCPLIFATAYDEFAIHAFELNAIDYLLKPFDFERFKSAFDKAKKIQDERLFELVLSLQGSLNKSVYLQRVFVKEGDKIHIISVSDIIAIESYGDYCKLSTKEKTVLDLKRLKAYEESLSPTDFLRIHRSSIIRLDQMKEIEVLSSHKFQVLMSNGKKYDISDSGYKKLKNLNY